jgi:tetratricopeptide (TPR) repeat protein
MRPELDLVLRQAAAGQSLNLSEVSRFSPADFRQGIQWLVAQDNENLALALADAGLSLYPQSEDILAIAGLLAMTLENWPLAIELLQDLCDVQQNGVQAMTYHMLARSLCCNLDIAEAHQVLKQGLLAWPGDATLLAEQNNMVMTQHALPGSSFSN